MHSTFQNIEEIFFAALEIEGPEARSAYLDEVCGETAMRQRVERLMALDAQAGGFLEKPASPPTAPWSDHAPMESPGSSIGPYRLIERLGEGGMGSVYRAEQTQPVHREVALKIIKPGMDTVQVVARFAVERQALALMDHPNIARVLDAGATESGRPYFVMDLVDGVPITAYCDRNHLTIAERLELFVLVCRAVQHAHQKGIIHRDLKPSNVLVTLPDGVPVPKVIDFGIAKATGDGLVADATLTGVAQVVGTPLYMSPEQADGSGHDVDTRSDVYSLGVLLYELLTGTTPFSSDSNQKAALDEIRRMLREQDPPVPSTRLSTLSDLDRSSVSANRRTDPRHLARAVRGELDWIVMKCLEKDRTRRYESVSGLADDLMRYLADQAVEAGPPSRLYRLTKYARRNRVALMTVGFVAMSLIAGTAVSTWQAIEAHRARKLATARYLVARKAVDTMYTEVAARWLTHEPHMTAKQVDFLREAMGFYEAFSQEESGDPEVQLAAAMASNRVGKINLALERADEAATAYRRSIAQLEPQVRRFPENREVQRVLGNSYRGLVRTLRKLHRQEHAEATLRQALTIHRALVATSPTPEDRDELSADLFVLGLLQSDQVTSGDAEASFREAIELEERLVADSSQSPKYRVALGEELVGLGEELLHVGRLADAESRVQEALAVWRKLADDQPSEQACLHGLAETHKLLARLRCTQGRSQHAEEEIRESLRILKRLAVDYPDVPNWRFDLAATHSTLAGQFLEESRYGEAEVEFGLALKILRQLDAELPGDTIYRSRLAANLTNLGLTLKRVNPPRLGEAEAALHEAQTLLQPLVAEFPFVDANLSSLATATMDLGSVQRFQDGRLGDAEASYREAHELFVRVVRKEPKSVDDRYNESVCAYALAQIQQRTPGRLSESEASYREALKTLERLAADAPDVARTWVQWSVVQLSLAKLLKETGRPAEAESAYRSAIDRDEKRVAMLPGDAYLASGLGAVLNNLAMCLRDRGELVEARRLLERALIHQKAALKINHRAIQYHVFLRIHLFALAGVLIDLGDHRAAAGVAQELGSSDYLEDTSGQNALDAMDYLKRCVELADHYAALTPEQRKKAMATYADRINALLKVLDRFFPADPFVR